MGIRDRLAQLFRSRSSRDRDQRMTTQASQRATSPAEEITQREDRRLGGMSTEDQAWEQDALRRHHASQDWSMSEDGRRQG